MLLELNKSIRFKNIFYIFFFLILLFFIKQSFADTVTISKDDTVDGDLDTDTFGVGERTYNVLNGFTFTINGSLSGGVDLTKAGAGVIELNGDNSGHSADWFLSAGTIAVGNDNAFGGNIIYIDGGTLSSDSSTARQVSDNIIICLLYTSPSPRDLSTSRMPSSA